MVSGGCNSRHVSVIFEECEYRTDLEQAITEGLEATGVSDVEVRVCGDFTGSVTNFTGQPYATERLGGQVGGRTLHTGPGAEPVIFIDLVGATDPELLEDVSPVDAVRRLAAHESGHVAMIRSGEDLSDADLVDLSPLDHLIRQLTSICVAEHRCEKALRLADFRDASMSHDRLFGLVVETHEFLTDQASSDNLVFAQRAAALCQGYVIDLALAAAWDNELGPRELRDLVVGPQSHSLMATLRRVPPAAELMGVAEYKAFLDVLTPAVVGAAREAGFEWREQRNESFGCYRHISDDLYYQRLRVATTWYQEQDEGGS